jgi:transcriptional regulator with XRE-family HTH domain
MEMNLPSAVEADEDFPRRIARLRKEHGLTIKQVAEYIQVPTTTYRDWEYGRAKLDTTYIKLAELFGVSVYELLGGKESEFAEIQNEVLGLEKHLFSLKRKLQSLF